MIVEQYILIVPGNREQDTSDGMMLWADGS